MPQKTYKKLTNHGMKIHLINGLKYMKSVSGLDEDEDVLISKQESNRP